MVRKFFIVMVLFCVLIGCAHQGDVYLDAMPLNDHEYTATTKSGLKTSFILARYYKKQYDDEYIIYPDYLDLFGPNDIDFTKTEYLLLHVKIVNLKRNPIVVWYKLISEISNEYRMLYTGKLPRKDLTIQLPIMVDKITYEYDVVFNVGGEELFRIWGKYTTKGGKETESDLNRK